MKDHQAFTDGIYSLCALVGKNASHTTIQGGLNTASANLSNDRLSIFFENGTVKGIYLDGIRQVDAGSLLPYLKWKNETYKAKAKIIRKSRTDNGRSVSIQIAGPLPGPFKRTIRNLVYFIFRNGKAYCL